MYDNTENALSQIQIVSNGGITFFAAADICGYSVVTEIQNSVKVLEYHRQSLNCGNLTGHPML